MNNPWRQPYPYQGPGAPYPNGYPYPPGPGAPHMGRGPPIQPMAMGGPMGVPPMVPPMGVPPVGGPVGPVGLGMNYLPSQALPGTPAETTTTQVEAESKPEETTKRIGIWSEHSSEDGKVYYYNHETKQSVWNKPAEFTEGRASDECDWKKYNTPEGKAYYHNAKADQTQWDMPEEYREWLERTSATPEAPKEEDPIEVFKNELRALGMRSTWTQDEAFSAINPKPIWSALKLSEKKKAFQALVAVLKVEEREEAKRKEQQNRDDFIKALFDCPEMYPGTSFREAMALISADARYLGVSSDREREKLFNDFWDLKEKRDREEQRQQRRQAQEKWREYVHNHPKITLDTQWRTFREESKDLEVFQAVDSLDSLNIFMDYIKELEKKEAEEFNLKKIENKRKSRAVRNQFRELLEEHLKDGKIGIKTKWKQFRESIMTEERYLNLLGEEIDGSTPAELFYDVIADLEEKYEKDKSRLKKIMRDLSVVIDIETSLEGFLEKIQTHEDFEDINEANMELLFTDFQEKAKKDAERTKIKAKKRFSHILHNTKITRNTSWENVSIPKSADITYLPLTEDEKQTLFEEELKKRALDDDFQNSDDDEDFRSKQRQSRGSRRSRSHSRSSSRSKSPAKRDDHKKDSHKRDEHKRDEHKRDDHKRDDYKRDDYKRDDYKRDDYKRDDYKRDDYKRERDDYKRDDYKRDDYKRDDYKRKRKEDSDSSRKKSRHSRRDLYL
eukprot:TRINITY_DN1222_c0_g1_i11.p1 TRINITY_DN1222_c0_g1~~TRINITY_DN1222_c0_g1_i11.p1  ORF type:complete len:729 (+),score=141.56 TRINITY_DN1222_c0_g1_i11:35-2221(+)